MDAARQSAQAANAAPLNSLLDHQKRPEFFYEHVWRVGDIPMWDDRGALHTRADFSLVERRPMRRVTIRGEKRV